MKPDEKTWKADDILDLLEARYSSRAGVRAAEWVGFRQVRAYPSWSTRTIDFWAINCWPSSGFRTVAVEVKVSRGDWLREANDPVKRREWKGLVAQFYFCAPKGIILPAEIPEGYGLLVPHGDSLKAVVQAKLDENAKPGMEFLAVIARRVIEDRERQAVEIEKRVEFCGRNLTWEEFERYAEKHVSSTAVYKAREQMNKEAMESRRYERDAGRTWRQQEGWILREILKAFGRSMWEVEGDKPEKRQEIMTQIRSAGQVVQVADLAVRLRKAADEIEGKATPATESLEGA